MKQTNRFTEMLLLAVFTLCFSACGNDDENNGLETRRVTEIKKTDKDGHEEYIMFKYTNDKLSRFIISNEYKETILSVTYDDNHVIMRDLNDEYEGQLVYTIDSRGLAVKSIYRDNRGYEKISRSYFYTDEYLTKIEYNYLVKETLAFSYNDGVLTNATRDDGNHIEYFTIGNSKQINRGVIFDGFMDGRLLDEDKVAYYVGILGKKPKYLSTSVLWEMVYNGVPDSYTAQYKYSLSNDGHVKAIYYEWEGDFYLGNEYSYTFE